MKGAYTHGKAQGHVDGGKHPLKNDHPHHNPWCLVLLDENVTTDPAERKVDA